MAKSTALIRDCHFLATAVIAIHHVLVDQARRRRRLKRGGGRHPVDLEEDTVVAANEDERSRAVDETLSRLAAVDARLAHIVELRVFAGNTVDEIAAAPATSPSSVTRGWRRARMWLRRELIDGTAESEVGARGPSPASRAGRPVPARCRRPRHAVLPRPGRAAPGAHNRVGPTFGPTRRCVKGSSVRFSRRG